MQLCSPGQSQQPEHALPGPTGTVPSSAWASEAFPASSFPLCARRRCFLTSKGGWEQQRKSWAVGTLCCLGHLTAPDFGKLPLCSCRGLKSRGARTSQNEQVCPTDSKEVIPAFPPGARSASAFLHGPMPCLEPNWRLFVKGFTPLLSELAAEAQIQLPGCGTVSGGLLLSILTRSCHGVKNKLGADW